MYMRNRLVICGWFWKHLSSQSCGRHLDDFSRDIVCNTDKNHYSEVSEDKLKFLCKSHSSVGRKYSWTLPKQLYYRFSNRNTLIQQFIKLIRTKMAACQMVPISLLWQQWLSPLIFSKQFFSGKYNFTEIWSAYTVLFVNETSKFYKDFFLF